MKHAFFLGIFANFAIVRIFAMCLYVSSLLFLIHDNIGITLFFNNFAKREMSIMSR